MAGGQAVKLFGLALLVLVPLAAFGHTANIPSARMTVAVDGTFKIRIRFDVLAFIVDMTPTDVGDAPMNALLDGPLDELESRLSDARLRFEGGLRISGMATSGLLFPTAAGVHRIVDSGIKPRLPVMMTVTVSGKLPKGAAVSISFPPVLGTVVLTTEFPYQEPISEPVEPSNSSTSLSVPTQEEVRKAAAPMLARLHSVTAHAKPNLEPKVAEAEKPANPSRVVGDKRAESTAVQPPPPTRHLRAAEAPPWYLLLPRYVKMGFTHILPEGFDHILFVLGLFFLSVRFKDLLKQISAFTIAHSLTLALSLYGVVRLSSSIVEPIIALSIVFVAVENLVAKEMKPWWIYVVFLFGLVHGLGFATALQDAGLQKGDILTALVGFNGGVELGQLTVIAGALLAFGAFRRGERYRALVTMPASLVIAAVGLVWAVQRIA